ncbi:HNH endonuclease [Micromonospora chersina]|uniref:HNH endonuclease n=1 Tax=Micromonospora chersina TaxID=47854 RepID=UPI003720679F
MAWASERYVTAAAQGSLHELDREDFELSVVAAEEMVTNYESRLVKMPGRPIYDAIRNAAADDRCPMCGVGTVSTLDHNLPKRLFPALAVNPLNLVPVCSDCNKKKLDLAPSSAINQLLHPYFDRVEDELWLYASVIEGTPAAFRFVVEPPGNWPAVLGERVKHQFKILGLARLYASQAAQELASIRHRLRRIHEIQGEAGVRAWLEDGYESKVAHELNGWRTAMYSAMVADAWFYSGGFDLR